ncbi:hypothetical protein FACS1894156_6410 [Bacteroidia bacterium]|nr:hypothetical protein FACS1894156_6410 [Bacteroidia bacterium]
MNFSIKKISLRGVFTGGKPLTDFFRKHSKSIILLVVLSVLFISNEFWVHVEARKRQALRKEITSLKAEATMLEMELVNLSSRNEIRNEIQKRGLNLTENKVPPIVLKMETKK